MTSTESTKDIFKRGMENLENNQIQEAMAKFSTVIELDPNCADAYLYRGFLQEIRYGDCLHDYERALQLNPEIPLTYPKKREELLQKLKDNWISNTTKFDLTDYSLFKCSPISKV